MLTTNLESSAHFHRLHIVHHDYSEVSSLEELPVVFAHLAVTATWTEIIL